MNNYYQQQSPRFSAMPPAVKNLLIANVVAFIATLILKDQMDLTDMFGMHYYESPHFKFYQIVTCMFLHGSIGHIFFNMYGLWMFGQMIEAYYGSRRFLVLYFVSGIGASLTQQLSLYYMYHDKFGAMFDSVTIGASGALFGVLVAFAMIYSEVQLYILFIPKPIKAKYAIPGYALIELIWGVSNVSGDSVAHWAHLGGALFGAIMVLYWRKIAR